MNFGQQIKWLDGNNKWHIGTVVARGNEQNTIWGVSHVLNPDQTTQPECFVSQQKGQWKVCNRNGIGQAQMAYTNPQLANTGKYTPQPITSAPAMGLGAVVYQEQYKKQKMVAR